MTSARYRLLDITPAGFEGVSRDITSNGKVLIAISGSDGILSGLVWNADSQLLLPPELGEDLDVRAVNDTGLVVGSAEVEGISYACQWVDGKIEFLVQPEGEEDSCAHDVNKHGVIVGYRTRNGPTRCILWFEDPRKYSEFYPDFVPFERAGSMMAMAVNEKGAIAGTVGFDAFIKQQDSYTRIRAPENGGVTPYSINNKLVVVGTVTEPDEQYPFRYTSRLESLGTIAGSHGYACDINDSGMVVGASSYQRGSNDLHAFLWHEGTMYDLNDIVEHIGKYTITQASAVSNSCQVAADAVVDGENRAVLLLPIA